MPSSEMNDSPKPGKTVAKENAGLEEGEQNAPMQGVDLSEDFQSAAHKITHKASKHELSHLRSKMNDREDAMRQEEQDTPKEYSMEGAPTSVGD